MGKRARRPKVDLTGLDEPIARMVVSLAAKYERIFGECRSWDMEDLIQSGAVGALNAMRSGSKSTGYHYTCIRREILKTASLKHPLSGRRISRGGKGDWLDVSVVYDREAAIYADVEPEPDRTDDEKLAEACESLDADQVAAVGQAYGVFGFLRLNYSRSGELHDRIRSKARRAVAKMRKFATMAAS